MKILNIKVNNKTLFFSNQFFGNFLLSKLLKVKFLMTLFYKIIFLGTDNSVLIPSGFYFRNYVKV